MIRKRDVRGIRLIEALEEKALTLGLDAGLLAQELGYTERYFSVLLRGERWIGTVGHDKLETIAKFLGQPLVNVYVLAEILRPDDFYAPSDLEKKIKEGYEQLRRNPTLAAWVPSEAEWSQASERMRLLCVMLLSKLTFAELEARAVDEGSMSSMTNEASPQPGATSNTESDPGAAP
jgi:hypothetical protein